MIFKNSKVFDVLKWIAIIALPAIGWFYGEVGPAWGFPFIDEIVLTLDRAGLLLGILLGVSNYQYKKLNGSNKVIKYDNDELAPEAEEFINGI